MKPKPERDQELDWLLDRARLNDADAWARLVERLEGLVYSIPRRMGLNEDDAADVFVTSFEALHQHLPRLSNAWAVPRWLTTTAARESLKIIRLRNGTVGNIPLDDVLAQEDIDAEEKALVAEQIERVHSALERMSPRCRKLLAALYQEVPPPYTELSARLGIPVGGIGPNRVRCLERLRLILKVRGFFE